MPIPPAGRSEPSFLLPCKRFSAGRSHPQYAPRGLPLLTADQRRSEDEDGDGDERGEPVRLNDAGLGDVPGAHDLSADLEDLLFFVPALIDIKVDAERGGEHGRGKVFRIVPRLSLGLAEGVMLADVAIGALVGRDGAADGCRQQASRLIAATAAQNAIGNGARLE